MMQPMLLSPRPVKVSSSLKVVDPSSSRAVMLEFNAVNLSGDVAVVRVLVSMIHPNTGFTSCMRQSLLES